MRVLIVDDSTLFRKVVRDTLSQCPGVEIVAVASDGKNALEKIRHYHPDLVTLDVEMPILNGIEVLRELQTMPLKPEVIMLSAMTDHGALATTQALRLGAFDFVLKPNQSKLEDSCAQLKTELLPKVKVLQERLRKQLGTVPIHEEEPIHHDVLSGSFDPGNAKVVGIGVSTGGPAALAHVLPKLPANLRVPLLIVQHMPPVFTRSLSADLDRSSKIKVQEAESGQVILPGNAYIAPGGKQMKVISQNGRKEILITDDPAERSCKPSVDYLFRSMAHEYGREAMAIVMTGMGDDGTMGCRLLKRHGCMVVAQEEKSCVVFGMPRQVIAAGLADKVTPLNQMHEIIESAEVQGGSKCR
ncbi:chemotaxis response regulator protein-glutamate methylesterase [Blastopirellula marina]|uniref:Protein-glutamate methylesterase/protein-glutamine glutaminase n=1 Tax=Blastopirellula marina TaxID=124 RepID=A0A2S8FMW7_9BACT|nr:MULTISPECIES: chemotaxis response regulator protein-glutamate methylesterase [Pirellulaceae]PQO33194.1 chemotaxis response regulator protein-glutamate methylesterase [Blastopirellula marina]RCS52283.1 chemotaxis response regulator protein-glutamate methylesterase [Bremerella cremea]